VTTNPTFANRALLLGETLVLSDLHVGRASASRVEYPLGERSDLRERLGDLLSTFDPGTVVVAGDLLHAFESVPEGVPETVAALRDRIAEAGAEFVAVRGNHDTRIDAVDVDPVDAHRVGETVVCHGHETPEAGAERYVVGHEHPAIVVEGRRRPCFLVGDAQYRDATVLVLPAFSALAAGRPVNDLRTEDCLSPLIADFDAFRPVVYTDGEPLEFPRLAELRPLL
jgi:putative SbcD/Mre11-related phosphoesterase